MSPGFVQFYEAVVLMNLLQCDGVTGHSINGTTGREYIGYGEK